MNKPKVYGGNAYLLFKKHKEDNQYVHIPSKKYGVEESERQELIRKTFNKYEFGRGDDEFECVVCSLNSVCNTEERKISSNLNGKSDYAIIFENGVELHIVTVDEYHGHGDYSLDVLLQGVYVPDNAGLEEVEEIARWLNVPFNIGCF